VPYLATFTSDSLWVTSFILSNDKGMDKDEKEPLNPAYVK
jgi:hypothetical protein